MEGMRRQLVVLDVIYDDLVSDPPSEWNWTAITDSTEPVTVLAAGYAYPITPEDVAHVTE